MNKFCPISQKTVNENTARVSALLVTVLSTGFLFTGNVLIFLFLAIDFFVRGFLSSRYSPVYITGNGLTTLSGMSGKKINAGPKIFAAQVGFILSISVIVANLFLNPVLASAFAIILLVCSFLEGAAGICIACKLYPYVNGFLRKKGS